MSSPILVPDCSQDLSDPCFLSALNFVSCLGQGAFGIVLQALNPSTNVSSAVKFIFPAGSGAKEEKQILRECQLASTLSHFNLVTISNVTRKEFNESQLHKIFDNLSQDDERSLSLLDMYMAKAKRYKTVESICIQMELCGQNLRKWLNVQPQHDKTEETVQNLQIAICRDIVDGVAYLHGKQIIHRDLKPENIMFSKSPDFSLPMKIGDFGLCRLIASNSDELVSSALTSRVGSDDYMAPEAFSNDYSFQADLFSLGLIIWEVIQLIPFGKRKPLFDRLVHDKLKKSVDKFKNKRFKALRELIILLTKKNTTERIQNIQKVVATFDNWLSYLVNISGELDHILRSVCPGEKIVLEQGVYIGQFELGVDSVEIVGQGHSTVLKLQGGQVGACFTITSDRCSISGMKIISPGQGNIGIDILGSKNIVRNIECSDIWTCVSISGDGNRLENLTLFNANNGITIQGSNNTLDHVQLEDIAAKGIWMVDMNSDHNAISRVTGRNVKNGIWLLRGSSNVFSNINLIKGSEDTGFRGMWLGYGSFHLISNLICTGYSKDKGDWALQIAASNCSLKNSTCGPIFLSGGRNTTLTNVDCEELIQVDKEAVDVTLINCGGQKLHYSGNTVTSTNCNFSSPMEIGFEPEAGLDLKRELME